MKVSDYDYNLPEELIAQVPLSDELLQDAGLNKENGEIKHCHFNDLVNILNQVTV